MKINREFIDLESDEIIINVIGKCASGKTAIQNIIIDALSEYGFNLEINRIDDDPKFTEKQIKGRIRAVVSKNKLITINEVQAVKTILS